MLPPSEFSRAKQQSPPFRRPRPLCCDRYFLALVYRALLLASDKAMKHVGPTHDAFFPVFHIKAGNLTHSRPHVFPPPPPLSPVQGFLEGPTPLDVEREVVESFSSFLEEWHVHALRMATRKARRRECQRIESKRESMLPCGNRIGRRARARRNPRGGGGR